MFALQKRNRGWERVKVNKGGLNAMINLKGKKIIIFQINWDSEERLDNKRNYERGREKSDLLSVVMERLEIL